MTAACVIIAIITIGSVVVGGGVGGGGVVVRRAQRGFFRGIKRAKKNTWMVHVIMRKHMLCIQRR